MTTALCLLSGSLLAQQPKERPVLRENERGEKIIVYPDGSWRYFNQLSNGGNNVLFDPNDDPDTQREADRLELYPVLNVKVLPYQEPVTLTEEVVRKIATRKSQLAKSAAEIARERADEAAINRQRLEAQLAGATKAPRQDARLIQSLNIRIRAARQTEKETIREAALAYQELQRVETLISKGNFVEELRTDQQRSDNRTNTTGSNNLLAGNFYENIAFLDQPAGSFTTLAKPVDETCRIAFEGVDEYTGLERRDVQQQTLFTHTDERLRLYLKDKEYLHCDAYLTALAGGYRYLSLNFTFAYPNAREAYGFIEKGSVLVINLMNGQSVYLRSGKMDKGHYDTEKEILTYRVHYPINQTIINTLRKSEADTIRVFWSSGYEEYEIYRMDFFINQISCLEAK